MKGDIVKFGRHQPPNIGHIVVESRHGLYSRGGKKRFRVELIAGRWICENGQDVTKDVERIEQSKQIKKLESLCKS
jgi:hypothetical protein